MTTDLTVPGDSTPAPYDRPHVPTIAGTRARLPEVGRIRLGDVKQPNKPGAKLGTFRFTSRDRSLVEAVAARYGGQVKSWDSDEGHQWQVISEASTVPVVVPRADLAFSQFYELWSGGGCQRRCDGEREMIGDRQCVCDPAARECKPTTRLSVMLPGIRGMGLWRVESHGDNARAEILGSIELASMYGASLVPANLTVVERWSRQPDPKKPGQFLKVRFVVPILVISDSIDEYVARAKELQAAELGLLPSGNDLAGPTTMRKLRATVFALWPESDQPGPERDRRLRQLSHMLGREVETISNDHDLTESEARRLASMVNELHEDPLELQAAPDSGPAAGPLAPEHPGPANISAGVDPEGAKGNREPEPPAEHHSDEELGEVPSPEGAEPGGGASDMTGTPPPGPAPAISTQEELLQATRQVAPTRKRRRTDPGRAPSVAELQAHQKTAEQTRKQETVDRTPADPLHWLPPADVKALVDFCYGRDYAEKQETARRLVRNMSLQMGLHEEWPADKLEILRQRTFGAKR